MKYSEFLNSKSLQRLGFSRTQNSKRMALYSYCLIIDMTTIILDVITLQTPLKLL